MYTSINEIDFTQPSHFCDIFHTKMGMAKEKSKECDTICIQYMYAFSV